MSIFVKVTAKKITGTFLCGHGVVLVHFRFVYIALLAILSFNCMSALADVLW